MTLPKHEEDINENKIDNVMKDCAMGPVTAQRCWEQTFFACPRYNGSYEQCTNNYPTQEYGGFCACDAPARNLCPHRINEKCFVAEMKPPCSTPLNIVMNQNHETPRINIWNSDHKCNNAFLCQCS